MKTKTVPRGWLLRDGRRLDCGPYMSGALEARVLLERLSVPKANLQDLTLGGICGIFNGQRFARSYVDDPLYGVPFLGSTDILEADLGRLPYLSRKQVSANQRLAVKARWTLITCSGTIGRMAFARDDMDGMAGSQHFMRVVPDEQTIPAGYLYAFLSSRFGVPLVVGGTYGAIIQHIEPEHIATLPVPRLGTDLEQKVDKLVALAASKRVHAASMLAAAVLRLEEAAGLAPLARSSSATPFCVTSVPSSRVQARLDGFFHSAYHDSALQLLRNAGCTTTTVERISTRIVEPPRFKRVSVEDAAFGVPFFGTTALFWVDPTKSYFLARGMRGISEYIVDRRCVLIPRSGQLSGIIGIAVLPYGDMVGGAVSEDAIRVQCGSEADAGFVFVALTSEYGRRQLKARAFGSSIPHLVWTSALHDTHVPEFGEWESVRMMEPRCWHRGRAFRSA